MEPALSIGERPLARRSRADVLGRSGEGVFILGCVALAFLIRLFLLPRDGVINGDGVYYTMSGRRIIAGDLGGISAYWSPLYPALLGVVSSVVDDLEYAGRLVSVVAGALLVIPAYLLIRDVYGRWPARLGTLLVVLHPALLAASGWVMTESLYTLILTSGILVGWHALRGSRGWSFVLTGLLLAAAYLTKPEAIGYLALFLALTLAAAVARRQLHARALVARPALLLAGFAVLGLPYLALLHDRTGSWTISQKLLSNATTAGQGKGLLELTDDGTTTMMDELWGDVFRTTKEQPGHAPAVVAPVAVAPVAVAPAASAPVATPAPQQAYANPATRGRAALLARQLRKQVREHVPALLPYPLLLLVVVGFVGAPWTRGRWAADAYLLSFFLCSLLGYALTVIELRYAFAMLPLLLAWTSRGVDVIGRWAAAAVARLRRGRPPVDPMWPRLVIALGTVLALTPRFPVFLAPDRLQQVPFEEKRAGLWLAARSDSSTLVMAASARVAFYAGARHLFVPDADLATVLQYAARRRVDYLVFGERRQRSTAKAFPIEQGPLPRQLREVYRDEPAPGYRVVVYQLVP